MPFTIAQLRAEIVNDPVALGYKEAGGQWKADIDIAQLLTLIRVGPGFKVDRDVIRRHEVASLIVETEYLTLTQARRDWIDLALGGDVVDFKSAVIRNGFSDCFAAGSVTRTNIVAYQQRDASRAEVLWGADTNVSDADVAQARL